jgi:hypothetical protein
MANPTLRAAMQIDFVTIISNAQLAGFSDTGEVRTIEVHYYSPGTASQGRKYVAAPHPIKNPPAVKLAGFDELKV